MFFSVALIAFMFDYHPPTTDRQREIHKQTTDGAAQLRDKLTAIESRVLADGFDGGSWAFDRVRDATKEYALALNNCVPEGDPKYMDELAAEAGEAIEMVAAARMFANRGVQLAAKGDVGGARRCFAVARTKVEEAEMRMNKLVACFCAALEADRAEEASQETPADPAGMTKPSVDATAGAPIEIPGLSASTIERLGLRDES